MRMRLAKLTVWLGLLGAAPAGTQIVLNAGTMVAIDPREPAALRRAAQDLVSDLEKVLGKAAPAAGAVTIRVGLEHMPEGVTRPDTRETLLLRASGKREIVLTGSDLRGAIYAVYEFSQRFLGVDPLWWWTDHAPARRTRILIPAELNERQGPPTFRYRGWFINDEDLLTGWRPGTADGANISLQVWDRVFEALLRLKGNMIVPGTFLFPDEPQVRAAGDRGLIVSQHHIEVVGLNTYRWPDERPYSFLSHPELLASAWRAAVRQYRPGQEVIWTLGYRGRHDRPFWSDDRDSPADDAGRARAIRAAIDRQIEIVRSERAHPYFLMNAWMEAVPFIRQGLLRIPEGVTLVWPDNGHGIIRDEGTIAAGQGVYYHTAMLNSRANQLTEMAPLARIRRELGRAAKAGATEYLLDNTSDIRPVPMTTRAVMELAWDARPWLAEGADGQYLSRWCREEFGERAAPPAAEYYRAYFEAPGRYGPAEHETLADNAYHTFARELLTRMLKGETRPADGRFAAICREADARWQKAADAARRAQPAIPAGRRDFFQAHVLTQLGIQLHSNRMLMRVAEAAQAPAAERSSHLKAAGSEVRAVLDAMRAAEYGQWAGFYQGDLFVNVGYTGTMIQALLEGTGLPAPAPVGYTVIKAYQGTRKAAIE